jgi:hypothetical protein
MSIFVGLSQIFQFLCNRSPVESGGIPPELGLLAKSQSLFIPHFAHGRYGRTGGKSFNKPRKRKREKCCSLRQEDRLLFSGSDASPNNTDQDRDATSKVEVIPPTLCATSKQPY